MNVISEQTPPARKNEIRQTSTPQPADRARVAIITGASSGIGRALASELAALGYHVGLVARRQGLLDKLQHEIESRGGVACAAFADVGDRLALRDAVSRIEANLGPVEVMVANAGVGIPTNLNPLNVADVEETFRVNVLGVVYAIETVLPGLLDRGSGQLVAISSMAAFKGLPGESAYCASKAAVNQYMEGLRLSVRGKGITVTTICPGFVATGITPMNSPAPFEISAQAAARKIARAVVRRRAGLVRFPWPMTLLMAILQRLPDCLAARLVAHDGEPASH